MSILQRRRRCVSFSGLSQQPTAALAYGLDFSIGALTCNAGWTSCTVAATFAPTSSGSLQDAIVVADGLDHVLATAYLRGKGPGPQVSFTPARVSIRTKRLLTIPFRI